MSFKPCNTEPTVVLLVDDDRNDQALFSLAVAQTNSSLCVQTVLDGQQAEEYLEGSGNFADRDLHPLPDLILLDLKMELSDGFEFLDWRNRNRQFCSIPVILFTGSQYRHDIQRALKLGATAHVAKPLAFQDLKLAVQEIWEIARDLPRVHHETAE